MTIATIFGVVSSILVSGLRQLAPDARVRFRQILDLLIRPGPLIAFCVSPVVIYGVLIAANEDDFGFLSVLAAFQNGFFWEQVLKGQSPTKQSA
jgi:hypothetical protein